MIHYWLSKIIFLDFMKPLGIWYLLVIIISNRFDSNSNIYWAELFGELLKLGLQLYQKSKLRESSQPEFTGSKSTMGRLKQCVKYFQS